MKTSISRGIFIFSLFFVPFFLGVWGCSKGYNPAQPQVSKQPDYQFTNILPYAGLEIGEVSEAVVLRPTQVDQLRAPVSELSSALLRDYESDEVELTSGAERYNLYLGRINAALTPPQQVSFGKLLGYHVDIVLFGKDLRFFLRRLARALQLTPEQVEQVKGCAKTYAEGAREVHKKVKDGTLSRDEARHQIQGLFEEFINCFKSALTAEQLEKLKNFLEHRRGH